MAIARARRKRARDNGVLAQQRLERAQPGQHRFGGLVVREVGEAVRKRGARILVAHRYRRVVAGCSAAPGTH